MRWLSICLFLVFSATDIDVAAAFDGKVMVPNLHPSGFSRNGKIKGIAVEIIEEVNRRAGGDTLHLNLVPYKRAKSTVQKGGSVIISNMAKTPSIAANVVWLYKVYEVNRFYVTRRNFPKLDHSQAKSLNLVGVLRNSSLEHTLKNKGHTNISAVTDERTNLRMLMAGRIEAWYTSNMLLAGALSEEETISQADIKMGDILAPSVPIYAAASLDVSPELVEKWRSAFASMEKDGTLKKIKAKYSF